MLGNFVENRKLYFIFSQWRIKEEGQVGTRTQSAGLGGASAHFAVI